MCVCIGKSKGCILVGGEKWYEINISASWLKLHWNTAMLGNLFIYVSPVAALMPRVVATETVWCFTGKKCCWPLFLVMHFIKTRGTFAGRGCFQWKLEASPNQANTILLAPKGGGCKVWDVTLAPQTPLVGQRSSWAGANQAFKAAQPAGNVTW